MELFPRVTMRWQKWTSKRRKTIRNTCRVHRGISLKATLKMYLPIFHLLSSVSYVTIWLKEPQLLHVASAPAVSSASRTTWQILTSNLPAEGTQYVQSVTVGSRIFSSKISFLIMLLIGLQIGSCGKGYPMKKRFNSKWLEKKNRSLMRWTFTH